MGMPICNHMKKKPAIGSYKKGGILNQSPEQIDREALAEVNRWMALANNNLEISKTLWNLDANHARRIYQCCRSNSEHLHYYLERERAVCRLFPSVLGAFAGQCALCGWDVDFRAKVRQALNSAGGAMFPMLELEGWVKTIECKVRSCAAEHSGLEIWRLMRMLRVKVGEPKAAKIDTAQYD